jgi:hypothetical protein
MGASEEPSASGSHNDVMRLIGNAIKNQWSV